MIPSPAFNSRLNPDAATFIPGRGFHICNYSQQENVVRPEQVNGIDAALSKPNLFSKFKALLCKVAQAPIALASKIARALKKTAEHVATWATFRKILIRVTCVATIIGISGTVAAMTANPALGSTVGVLLGAAAQEILSTSVSAFINEGIFA